MAQLGLGGKVLVYSGADEAQLALLSYAVRTGSKRPAPRVSLVFRNFSSAELIPNYEGDPLVLTAERQIEAAGGVPDYSSKGDILLLINNFDSAPQKEAAQQFTDPNVSYGFFDRFVCSPEQPFLAFADSRYSNGADGKFVEYALSRTRACGIATGKWTYAGWNTNGNTLGTTVANAVLLYSTQGVRPAPAPPLCAQCCGCQQADTPCVNGYFNVLRVTEDRDWQTLFREQLRTYMKAVPGLPYDQLALDLPFFSRFAFKPLAYFANSTAHQVGYSDF